MNQTILEKIRQRRLQILVHSCIYYEYDTNIIDDHTYNRWAHELDALQNEYPEIAEACPYAEAFRKFDGSTGFDLPKDDWVKAKAKKLLEIRGLIDKAVKQLETKNSKSKPKKETSGKIQLF